MAFRNRDARREIEGINYLPFEIRACIKNGVL